MKRALFAKGNVDKTYLIKEVRTEIGEIVLKG